MKSKFSLMKIHPLFFRWGNHFFFKSKDIKEVFPSFFLLIMSRASGVLHIKVYGHFPLVCNYLIQFYRKRSNLGLFQKDSEQTWEIILSKGWVENTVAEIWFFSPPKVTCESKRCKIESHIKDTPWITHCLSRVSVWSKKALFTFVKLLN